MKVKGMIINAVYSKWADKKTGEINEFTKITYTLDKENTDNMIGSAVRECNKKGNYLDYLRGKILIPVTIDIVEKATADGSKYSISKINDKEL